MRFWMSIAKTKVSTPVYLFLAFKPVRFELVCCDCQPHSHLFEFPVFSSSQSYTSLFLLPAQFLQIRRDLERGLSARDPVDSTMTVARRVQVQPEEPGESTSVCHSFCWRDSFSSWRAGFVCADQATLNRPSRPTTAKTKHQMAWKRSSGTPPVENAPSPATEISTQRPTQPVFPSSPSSHGGFGEGQRPRG